jgi:hypothetical protein
MYKCCERTIFLFHPVINDSKWHVLCGIIIEEHVWRSEASIMLDKNPEILLIRTEQLSIKRYILL